jgi:hypothetical protein
MIAAAEKALSVFRKQEFHCFLFRIQLFFLFYDVMTEIFCNFAPNFQ